MQDSMYSAMFGALTQEHRLAVIANNLANVNTTGYKKESMAFKDVMIHYATDVITEPLVNLRSPRLLDDPRGLSKVRITEKNIDFTQGSLKLTEGPLDVAIMGEGFFKVANEQGEFLTRNGHFHVLADGSLVTAEGDAVLGEGGEITLPPGAKILIDETGQIFADGELQDQLTVVNVDDPTAIRKFGHNLLFIDPESGAAEVEPEETAVAQGFLEAANVNVVEEMVNMIEAQRAFEAYNKMIKSTDEMDKSSMEKVGMTR